MIGLDLGLIFVVLLIAGVIKGASGLGYLSCALPPMVLLTDIETAIIMLLAPTMLSNLGVILLTPQFWPTLRSFWPLYIAALPGCLLGVQLLGALHVGTATLFLAVIILFYAATSLRWSNLRLSCPVATGLRIPVGFCNGVLAGLTGSQILPLVPYALALEIETARVVQLINTSVVFTTFCLGIAFFNSGELSYENILLSTASSVPAMIGIAIGTRLRGYMSVETFRVLVLSVLFVIGLVMMVKAGLGAGWMTMEIQAKPS